MGFFLVALNIANSLHLLQHKKSNPFENMDLNLYLAKNKISKGDFAKRIGVNRSYLSQIIMGVHPGSDELRSRIIEATEGEVTWTALEKGSKKDHRKYREKRAAQED